MTVPADILALLTELRSTEGTLKRARTVGRLWTAARALDGEERKELAIALGQRFSPKIADRLEAGGAVESPELLNMIRSLGRVDAEEIDSLISDLGDPEAREELGERALASLQDDLADATLADLIDDDSRRTAVLAGAAAELAEDLGVVAGEPVDDDPDSEIDEAPGPVGADPFAAEAVEARQPDPPPPTSDDTFALPPIAQEAGPEPSPDHPPPAPDPAEDPIEPAPESGPDDLATTGPDAAVPAATSAAGATVDDESAPDPEPELIDATDEPDAGDPDAGTWADESDQAEDDQQEARVDDFGIPFDAAAVSPAVHAAAAPVGTAETLQDTTSPITRLRLIRMLPVDTADTDVIALLHLLPDGWQRRRAVDALLEMRRRPVADIAAVVATLERTPDRRWAVSRVSHHWNLSPAEAGQLAVVTGTDRPGSRLPSA